MCIFFKVLHFFTQFKSLIGHHEKFVKNIYVSQYGFIKLKFMMRCNFPAISTKNMV